MKKLFLSILLVCMMAVPIFVLSSCESVLPLPSFGEDEIYVNDAGYLVVNGVETEYEVKNKNHSFSDWTLYNENEPNCEKQLYYRICSDCSVLEWKDNNQHIYPEHYEQDNLCHWQKCLKCDHATEKAEHSLGEDGNCSVCNQAISDTVGVMYDISKDGTYYEVIGYTGAAKSIKIAEEYNGKPVKSICSSAFKGSSINSVVIPNSITSIGKEAFSNCTNLVSVVLPDSVTSIDSGAFYGCSKLASITIPANVTSIGDEAFYGCGTLTAVHITDMAKWCNIAFSGDDSNPLYYAKNLYLNEKLVTELMIPDSVTTIGKYAFIGCDSLISITIPDGVTTIGDGAFENCSNLTNVTIPDGVTTIGYRAFENCSNLTNVTIPNSVVEFGSYVFDGCSNLQYNGYEYGKYLGNDKNPYLVLLEVTNKNLSSYTIHENTKIIADHVFSNCSRLTSIAIPDAVTSIGDNAFSNCSGLTSVTIPNSVTFIDIYAFGGCANLTSIIIPNSVTSIDHQTFKDSFSLADVYYTGTQNEWVKLNIGFLYNATIHYNYTPEE